MRNVFVLAALSLGLSACTVSVRTTADAQATQASQPVLIQSFRPERGEASSYFVGENVRFQLTTRTPGYVTLVSLDPNGNSNFLVRDAFVQAGTTIFPRAVDRAVYTLTPPRGVQRVRAIFTTSQPANQLVLRGTFGEADWRASINAYLSPFASGQSDVQETFFYIR